MTFPMSVASALFSSISRFAVLSGRSTAVDESTLVASCSALDTSLRVDAAIVSLHSAILASIPAIFAETDSMDALTLSSFSCSRARCSLSFATCSRWSAPSCTACFTCRSSDSISKSISAMRPSDAAFSAFRSASSPSASVFSQLSASMSTRASRSACVTRSFIESSTVLRTEMRTWLTLVLALSVSFLRWATSASRSDIAPDDTVSELPERMGEDFFAPCAEGASSCVAAAVVVCAAIRDMSS